jgi:hypothetical protein
MSAWDELSPEQRARVAAETRRNHSSAVREQQIAVADAQADVLGRAIDWLESVGFTDAAAALQSECFEAAPA